MFISYVLASAVNKTLISSYLFYFLSPIPNIQAAVTVLGLCHNLSNHKDSKILNMERWLEHVYTTLPHQILSWNFVSMEWQQSISRKRVSLSSQFYNPSFPCWYKLATAAHGTLIIAAVCSRCCYGIIM